MMQRIKEFGYKMSFNLFQLIGWILVLHLSLGLPQMFGDEQLHSSVIFARIVQVFQVTDFYTAGVNFPRVLQIGGRLSVLFAFTRRNSPVVFVMLLVFSVSEIIRYLYYIVRENPLFTWVRYNAFLVLYPIGFTCEALLAEFTIRERNYVHDGVYFWARGHQVFGVLGLAYNYLHLLRERRSKLRKLKGEETSEAEKPKERIRDENFSGVNRPAKRVRD